MLQLVRRRPRFGYRRIAALLRGEGFRASESRVLRLWRKEGLKVPQKKRKRGGLGVAENGCDRRRATHKNHVWAWDFVFDRTTNGTQLKWLSIVDEHTRECLALKCDRSITSEDVIDTLAELFAMRGVPEPIRSDNGPEFTAKAIRRMAGSTRRRDALRRAGSARGRTATPRASTAGCGTSSWSSRSSSRSRQRGGSRPPGERTTTTTGRTAPWGTSPRVSSRPAAPTPLRSRFRLRLKRLLRYSGGNDLTQPVPS